MKKRRQTPQLRKTLNYERHQRGSSYGENHKSSRIAVRKRKAFGHRSVRRAVAVSLSCAGLGAEQVEDALCDIKRSRWRKVPDSRLIEHLDRPWSSSSRTKGGSKFKNSKLAGAARRRLLKRMGRREFY